MYFISNVFAAFDLIIDSLQKKESTVNYLLVSLKINDSY